MQLRALIYRVVPRIVKILNDGDWGVTNQDLLIKELLQWIGIVIQTLKDEKYIAQIEKETQYQNHSGTRIKTYWKYFLKDDSNHTMF